MTRGEHDPGPGGTRDLGTEPAPRLIYAIGQFHTVLRAELARRLREEELTVPEFTALSVLNGRAGLSNAQLARRSFVTPQAMNQVLASLETKGLVVRPPAPGGDGGAHHRARSATLTPAGRASVDRAQRLIDEIEDVAFAALGAEERAAVAQLLREGTRRLLDRRESGRGAPSTRRSPQGVSRSMSGDLT